MRHAERIIVKDHGRIIEEGKHEILLASSGHCAELYNTCFRHQSLEYIESWVRDGDEQVTADWVPVY